MEGEPWTKKHWIKTWSESLCRWHTAISIASKNCSSSEPALVHASWDWGDGDWESDLGAASHTGSKAIAAYLLEKGAYMDIFCAAMLGKVDILKAFLKDNGDLAQ